jgi:transposase-like protein
MKNLFAGRHFDREVILLCVRWYLRYKLSLRDLVEMMAERGLRLAHTTIMRWMQRYVPEFEKCWARDARKVGRSWRVDETYLKVRGRWVYLYRAVDRDGSTVDFRLSPKRDAAAAKAFCRKALRTHGRAPVCITLDGYAASIEQCARCQTKTRHGSTPGCELIHRIRKGQFALQCLRLTDQSASTIWNALLAA